MKQRLKYYFEVYGEKVQVFDFFESNDQIFTNQMLADYLNDILSGFDVLFSADTLNEPEIVVDYGPMSGFEQVQDFNSVLKENPFLMNVRAGFFTSDYLDPDELVNVILQLVPDYNYDSEDDYKRGAFGNTTESVKFARKFKFNRLR